MIPKVIHQFWDRPVPPDDVAACIQTWRDHHPGWTHILWNDESALSLIYAHFGLEAARFFAAGTIASMRSDMLRAAALLVIGGVYSDADVACSAPIERLRRDERGCVLYSAKKKRAPVIRTDVMLAAPRHPFIRRFWERVLANLREMPSDHLWILTGPGVVASLWADSPEARSGVSLIDHHAAHRYFGNRIDLHYRKADHWSDQQRRQPILNFARAARIEKVDRIAKARAAAEATPPVPDVPPRHDGPPTRFGPAG